MNRKSLLVALATLFAGGLMALGWWLGRHEGTAMPSTPATGDTQATAESTPATDAVRPNSAAVAALAAAASIDTTAEAAAVVPSDPLPPADTLVVDAFDDLLAKARAGDARAACRLASDLLRCQLAKNRWDVPPDMTNRISREDDEQRRNSMIEFAARYEEERERSDRICAGVTPAHLDQAFSLQMQAAQARPELRVWAAIQPALEQRFFVNDLDRWQQYRTVALPWLEAAAAQGDLTALIAMTRIHGDDRNFGPRTPPFRMIDDGRMVTYATLLERYGITVEPISRAADEARSRLEPSEQAQAEQRATELFRPELAASDARSSGDALRVAMRRSFGATPQDVDCD